MKKKLTTFALVLGLSVAGSMSAFAGEWKQDNIGWWYQNDDGSYPVNQWMDINGKWYHFGENGYMSTNCWVGGTYYVGADGAMMVNTTTPDGYKVGADGAWIQDTQLTKLTLRPEIFTVLNTSYKELKPTLRNEKQEWYGSARGDEGQEGFFGVSRGIKADNFPFTLKVDFYQEYVQGEFYSEVKENSPNNYEVITGIEGSIAQIFDGVDKEQYTFEELDGYLKNLDVNDYLSGNGITEMPMPGLNGNPNTVLRSHRNGVTFNKNGWEFTISGINGVFDTTDETVWNVEIYRKK